MPMWSTKLALTAGIQIFEPRRKPSTDDGYVWDSFIFLKIGRDAFHTLAEAQADAEKRRQKRLGSLRKQISTLEGLQFGSATSPVN